MRCVNVPILLQLSVQALESPHIARLPVRHADGTELLSCFVIHGLLIKIQFRATDDQPLNFAGCI
jgi:hypothetical protein